MNQLSLFEMDEMTVLIYEAFDDWGYPYEVDRHVCETNHSLYGAEIYVKTKCGRLVYMLVATSRAAEHQLYMVYENLSDAIIEKYLAKIEAAYK